MKLGEEVDTVDVRRGNGNAATGGWLVAVRRGDGTVGGLDGGLGSGGGIALVRAGGTRLPKIGSEPEPRRPIGGEAGGAEEKAKDDERPQERACAASPRAAQYS